MSAKSWIAFLAALVLLFLSSTASEGGKVFVGLGVGGGGLFAFGSQGRGFVVLPGFPLFAPFGHPFWVAPPWNAPFWWYPRRLSPGPEVGFSGVDPSGALFINGYRVASAGWLRVQVEPVDAEVLVNGFRLPLDPATGRSASLGLLIGTHRVEARKAGFEPVQTEVEIQQARELFLPLRLQAR